MERFIELGSCYGHAGSFEMAAVANGNETRAKLSFETAGLDSNYGKDLGTGWLEAAAPVYNISPDIRDYVISPIIIFPTGLPNRNAVSFSLAAVSRFDPELGCLGYESFRRKPTFENHNNEDHTAAKGVVFDTRMLPLGGTNGRVWKAVALAGFDRTRDPELANNILTGEYNSYSMGASVGRYECAVCGHLPTKNEMRCEHIGLDKRDMKTFQVDGRGNVLSHYVCDYLQGFEISVVHPTPAWASAHTPTDHLLNLR